MSYFCKYCNYLTDDSGNFSHHKKSKKHLKNLDIIALNKTNKKINVSKILKNTGTVENTENTKIYSCELCNKNYQTRSGLFKHKKTCNDSNIPKKDKISIKELQIKLEFSEKEKEMFKKFEKEKTDLLNTLLKLPFNELDITKFNIDNKIDINDINNNRNLIVKNPSILTLNNIQIISRTSDNYINATQLCNAGKKKFNHWYSLDTTKELINELESDTGIPVSQLVDIKKGNTFKFNQGSWVHPDLAIQIAQWISPHFALQVSKWIRTLFIQGKVEIHLNQIREKENIIKLKEQQIKSLENKYIKKQKRNEYPENVIYIVTTDDNKKNGIYIIGKAEKLKNRLSTYNKTSEHEVIYYKECKNIDQLKIIESMVLAKLNKYKEKANRDRFILPQGQNISLFTKIIDESVKFFN